MVIVHIERILFPHETRPTEGGIDLGIENPFLDGGVVETSKFGLDSQRILFPDETKPTESGIDLGIENPFLDGGVVETSKF
ncbi:hypothetical protein Avbf_01430 [Armadillidium vulgare]|nr:hypothetical protein Avbf_01430 [Armadillidium vulgare]